MTCLFFANSVKTLKKQRQSELSERALPREAAILTDFGVLDSGLRHAWRETARATHLYAGDIDP
jgi:hypothetical protein